MNLENGFSFTQHKGDVWMPATPEKPVLHRSNQVLVEMQQSEKRQENWEELLGIYSGFLQYRNHSELPPECSRNSLVDLNQSNPTTGSFSPAQMYDTVPQQVLLPWDHPVGLNHRGHSILDGNPVDKQRSSNHNAGNVISNLQSRGDTVPHMKVDSIAELMGMKSTLNTPTMNGDRITCVVDKPSSIGPYSQVERNWKTYRTDDMMHLQKQILNGNHDGNGYNLPQIPTSRLSVTYRPSYNLNLQPMMEAGESSSVSGPLHQESVTPDQQKLQKKNEILQVPLMSIDDISTTENNKQDNAIQPQLAENGQMEHNNSVLDSEGKNDGEIDLNKTPAQKTPKRRKHRPKVVVEGKPKRTPKPKATEKNTPEGNSTKRKYVRKKGVKTSTDQPTDDINRVEVSNVEFQAKTCKRSLNFDLENGVGKKIKRRESDPQADNIEGSTSNLNVDIQNAELNRQFTMNDLHQKTYEKQKMTENPYRSVTSVDEIPPHETLPFTATSSPLALTNRALNVIARSLSMRNANINQSGSERMNVHAYHHIDGGLAQILASTSKQNLDGIRQPQLQNKPQLQKEFADASGKHESQREFFHNELKQRLMVSQIWPEMGHYNRESESFGQNGLESSWIKKVENKMFGCSSSQTSGNRIAKDCSEKIKSTWNKNFHGESSKVHQKNGLPYLRRERKSTFIDLTDETNMVTYDWSMNSTNSGHRLQKQGHSFTYQIAHTSHHFAKAHTTVANSNIIFASQRDCQATRGRKIADPANVSVKRQAARQAPPSTVSRNLQGVGRGSKKVAGSHDHKKNIFSIDDIIDHMKRLYIGTNNGKGIVGEEQNALVPYRPDGAVVPFEAFDPIQKRRSRPKVDLDPETDRLWNLLMGKEGSESAETLNENKQKFWEDERKVFHGRVDSFIARMHLVQGDRRFSKWKGSVVDSVIGVFLTQNVSDHLSSSAFMSLAARFPPKSTTTKGSQSTEHEVIISYPDERTSCHHRLTKEPVFDHGSVISSQPSKYKEENVTSEKTVSINNCIRRKEEGMISSQSSSDSVIFQTSEDIRSSSGSNSEAEDQITGSSFRKKHGPLNVYEQAEGKQFQDQETGSPFPVNRTSNDDRQPKNLQHSQNPGVGRGGNACCNSITNSELHDQGPLPQSTNFWQKMLAGMDENETDLLEFSVKECTSSLTSTHFHSTCGINMEHAHVKAGGNKESNLTDHQTRSFKFVNNEFLNKHPEQIMNLPTDATESQSRNNQHIFNCSQGGTGTCQQEGSFLTDPVKAAGPFRQRPSGNQNPSENITLQPTEMKTMHTSDEPPSKISSASNVRKRKAEKEKVEPFNWDTLRKQVQSEAGTQRSRRTLDSLDYEALQNASVHEISQTIKERGMNNLLAERMKDFLNRLVKDHGSIDLEWLRDVQPDKSKDYLLSIRGLGLKSVECVRLLTLHHLAFPVDTNVGRIAVRLGWVPLQPLPETLQLHLLELYPVLETIQKYLWPRLCMLDQETLYELHYQLITFGKVFCTKRQPNCNACPMRGECRHFASAFASARLALPGPEERRVVCSNVPSCSSKCCGVVVQPMLLPPAEDNVGSGPAITGNCEPIIEEPSTPESSIEVTERDIEDAFYDDPDEIPEIKLNIEEFTTNLQSFMQEKMEMQEGDMSKALVALSPGFASIPTPKLKHVSRLRTEHQVYELPDSHPLLKGMDRREPDDPSPYLLAMWAPGETADSVQPTENECCPAKGGMCNLQTCFSCNSMREAQSQTVRGTILIPCRTAMRGSFPLNGTYFQVNEVFADDETSVNPIDVPRSLIWNLPRRTVFFGTSVSTIFKGLSTEDIQYCFWKGFVCVRGFNQKTRAPRPLKARLHLTASMMAKKK